MLPPDLIQTRRRGEELKLVLLTEADTERALELAQEILFALAGLVGRTQEEVELVLSGIECLPKDKKLSAGLVKLALDSVSFEAASEITPADLRRRVFARAAEVRIQVGAAFDRNAILGEIAEELAVTPVDVERALFSDLKGAAELRQAPGIEPKTLVESYCEAQLLGVFLRAVRVRALLRLENPADVRRLFWKLKFRELLFRLDEESPGVYRLELEGPTSLLASSTRYGLRFSQTIRALRAAGAAKLEADVLWGKGKRPLIFRHTLAPECPGSESEPDSWIRPELKSLLESPVFVEKGFLARPSNSIFNVPGVGVCVPDLEFVKEDAEPIFFELLGEGSRDAVFRRAEWARETPGVKIVFAASSRLRVSSEIMDGSASGSLLVYKGSLSAKKVLEQIEGLGSRPKSQ